MFETEGERRFDLPEGLTPEEELEFWRRRTEELRARQRTLQARRKAS